MKTIEEQVKEIKQCADCAIYTMVDHKLPWLPDDGSFDNVINSMHIAQNKDQLSEAYYAYINLCINHGYSDGEIIGGIMQNDTKNKEFNVNIDTVIKSLIEIKTPVKLTEPTEEPVKQVSNNAEPTISADDTGRSKSFMNKLKSTSSEIAKASQPKVSKEENTSAGGIKITNKSVDKIKKKVNYVSNLANKLQNNNSEDPVTDFSNIVSIGEEVKRMISAIDPTSCNEEEISELNDLSANAANAVKKAKESFKIIVDSSKNNSKQETIAKESTNVEQAAAAHTEGGFNIGNFVKQDQQPVTGPNMPGTNTNKQTQQKKVAFPHEICGLTDEQIKEEVKKHFKVLETLPAYPLYDLLNNKLLAKMMKSLDAKQRPNNPYLTQVNINEYIDVPDLLSKYSLCFTMPCNDKNQVIMVLFNPNPVPDKNGVLQYPLHIFKATRNNNTNK